jgi:hypothetical protein
MKIHSELHPVHDCDFLLQFYRNGRWGNCTDCPRDKLGRAYPEFCANTNRHDHLLNMDDLVSHYNAIRREDKDRPNYLVEWQGLFNMVAEVTALVDIKTDIDMKKVYKAINLTQLPTNWDNYDTHPFAKNYFLVSAISPDDASTQVYRVTGVLLEEEDAHH